MIEPSPTAPAQPAASPQPESAAARRPTFSPSGSAAIPVDARPIAPTPLPTSAQPSYPPVAHTSYASADTTQKGSMPQINGVFLVLSGLVIAGGIATGVGLNKLSAKEGTGDGMYQGQPIQQVAGDASSIKKGQIFGSANEKDFKDFADGYLELGGIDGEGSHKLLREGGLSQTVYLTSSITDLSKFEGMKIKVWGETNSGQKAGWLMDVGRVEVLETKAEPPAWSMKGSSTTTKSAVSPATNTNSNTNATYTDE